jgi:hypothetical protein
VAHKTGADFVAEKHIDSLDALGQIGIGEDSSGLMIGSNRA